MRLDLPRGRVRDDLAAFDLAAVFVARTGRVEAFSDLARVRPLPDDAVWWTQAGHAEALRAACEAEGTTDITGMAPAIGVPLMAHSVCLERCTKVQYPWAEISR